MCLGSSKEREGFVFIAGLDIGIILFAGIDSGEKSCDLLLVIN